MRSILQKITVFWALAGGVLLLGIVAVTMVNVSGFIANMVARNFGGYVSGLSGYEDAVTLAIGMAALSFFPYCQATKGHISVDLFTNFLSDRSLRIIEIISDIFITIIAFFLGYMMIEGALQIKSDTALSPVLEWPVWPFYIPGIISCFLWGIVAVSNIFYGYSLEEAELKASQDKE